MAPILLWILDAPGLLIVLLLLGLIHFQRKSASVAVEVVARSRRRVNRR